MDEQEIQRKRRDNEENATRNRARILGIPYLDTRNFEQTIALIPDLIPLKEMREKMIIPLQVGEGEVPYRFMITSQSPNSLLPSMQREYTDEGKHIEFFLISNAAYQAFMERYDPPAQIHYGALWRVAEGEARDDHCRGEQDSEHRTLG